MSSGWVMCVRPAVGFPGYFVDMLGSVWSQKRSMKNRDGKGVIRMKADITEKGYERIVFRVGGKYKRKRVHQVVMEAFSRARREHEMVCHNDGNRRNNHIDNLRYDTARGNQADRWKHGTMRTGSFYNTKLTEDDVLAIRADTMPTNKELARVYGVSVWTIRDIRRGVTWRHILPDFNPRY